MIKYTIKTTNLSLTPALDQFVESKVKAISRFVDKNDTSALADVEIGKISDHHRRGEIFRAEFNVSLAHHKLFRAEETQVDLYNAINGAKNEVIRQIKTTKNKQETLTKRGGRRLKNILRDWTPRRKN